MLMENLNWMQVEEYLKHDDRVVLVTGSTEEHGYNTVGTDTQVPWEIARIACDKTGVMLAPQIPYAFAGWPCPTPAPSASSPRRPWPWCATS